MATKTRVDRLYILFYNKNPYNNTFLGGTARVDCSLYNVHYYSTFGNQRVQQTTFHTLTIVRQGPLF
jgi:hypothetical protein